jgi:hypothetical protein
MEDEFFGAEVGVNKGVFNGLDDSKLSADQKAAPNLTLVKLRGMAYQKMKLLK